MQMVKNSQGNARRVSKLAYAAAIASVLAFVVPIVVVPIFLAHGSGETFEKSMFALYILIPVLLGLFSLVAVILGALGVHACRKHRQSGEGAAWFGLILGSVMVSWVLLAVLQVYVFPMLRYYFS